MKIPRFTGALRIAAIYAIIAGLWILLSDKILFLLIPNHETAIALETYKGWAFVGITAYLLYWERKRADESFTKDEAKTVGAIPRGKPYRLIWLGIGLSIFFLTADALFDVFYFRSESILEQIISPSPYEVYMRFSVVAIILIFSSYAQVITWRLQNNQSKLEQELEEQKRTKVALGESEARFSLILQTSPNAMLIVAKDGRIVQANEQAEKTFGYESGALNETLIEELMPEQFRMIHQNARAGYVNEPYQLSLRERNHLIAIHKDGSEFPVEISLGPLKMQGRTYVVATIVDITERKQAELALREAHDQLEERVRERTAELVHANRAKDEFLASMSHELRTPLNSILNLSESLEEGIYGTLAPRQLEILRSVEESGRHLLELINDILDLSKIEAGKLELQIDTVSVESLCQASLRIIKQTAMQKRLQVSTTIMNEIEIIHADQRRVKQMLVNLLSNAVKFTPDGGRVGLEVTREGDEAIRFTVWDTGIGIPEEQLEKLFKPFVQLDSSLARQYGGTGLGLALVRDLAELHGGSVGMESKLGKGSRFYFIIPIRSLSAETLEVVAHEPSAQHESMETRASQQHGKKRILLVEDNATNMMVTGDYLTNKGYRVIPVMDGSEAIERAQADTPDLILMDIQMPGMDGLETIRRLRTMPKLGSVPIIALTALAMPGDRERCLEAGANDYIAKPASLKTLFEKIGESLK